MQFHALEPSLDSPEKVSARAKQCVSTPPAQSVAQLEPGIDWRTKPVESSQPQDLKNWSHSRIPGHRLKKFRDVPIVSRIQ